MENSFISFRDAIEKFKSIDAPKRLSQRAELFKELYSYYEKSYKKNTWLDYIKWLKENHIKHTKESIAKFDKIKRKPITVKSFCSFWLSHIPTIDLYYLISIAKDMENRNQNFNKWLFWSIKCENTTT